MKKIIIALDGYSSCGKSTMAKDLAKSIGYVYIDTGAMYRAVTLYCLRNKLFEDDILNEDKLRQAMDNIHISFRLNEQTGHPDTWLNGKNVEQEIRSMEVANKVSPVSAIRLVRKAMVALQQAMGEKKGVVMDGRDIGTVVFPRAEMKVFVTASPEVRAQRRWDELQAKGENISYEEVYQNLIMRDKIDSTREEGPLRQAEDAFVLDNSNMTIEQQRQWLFDLYEKIVAE